MLELSDVSFSYDKTVLQNINLSFPNRGIVVILGKSGCGKSTLLFLMNGLLRCQKGEIRKDRVTTIFQNPLLLDYLTVSDNVAFSLLLNGEKKDEALKKAYSILNSLDILFLKDKLASSLSGGEKMRVSLARGLVMQTDIILLDEPTGQLDEKNSALLYSLFKKLSEDKLIVLVTHDEKNAVPLADDLYVLKDKKLKEIKRTTVIEKRKGIVEKKKTVLFSSSFEITLKYLKHKKKRIFLFSFFISLLMSLLYFFFAISFSKQDMLSKIDKSFFNHDCYRITYIKKIDSGNRVSLNKMTIPSTEVLSSLDIKQYYPSLSYFLPEYYSFSKDGKEDIIYLLPFFEKEYKSNQSIQVYINDSFKDYFLSKDESKIIDIKRRVLIYLKDTESKDALDISLSFDISGVFKEINLLNKPTIYYNYFQVKEYLDNLSLININQEKKDILCLKDIFDKDELRDEDILSHEVYFQSEDISSLLTLSKKLYGDKVEISSKKIEFFNNFNTIFSSLKMSFLLFFTITCVSSFLLQILSIYSLFLENIRLFALTYYYSSRKSVNRFVFSHALIFSFCIYLLLFAFVTLLSFLLNLFLKKLSLSFIYSSFSIPSFSLVILLIFFLSLIASFFALSKIRKDKLIDQFKGED